MQRDLVEVLAVFLMFALSLTAALVWWAAYLNGGSVEVAINTHGEQWAEFVLWIGVTAVVVVGLHSFLARPEGA